MNKIIIISVVLLLTFIPRPANALSLKDLDKFFEFIGIKDYVAASLDKLIGIFPDRAKRDEIKAETKAATGELGTPDLNEIDKKVGESIEESSLQTQKQDILANIEAETVKGYADGLTNKEGQAKTKASLKATQDAVEEMENLAEQAQSETITQDVMKRMASQNAQQGIILKTISNSLATNEKTSALAARVAADSLKQQIAENQKEEREEDEATLLERSVIRTYGAYNDNSPK
jgi:hypothetical protein